MIAQAELTTVSGFSLSNKDYIVHEERKAQQKKAKNQKESIFIEKQFIKKDLLDKRLIQIKTGKEKKNVSPENQLEFKVTFPFRLSERTFLSICLYTLIISPIKEKKMKGKCP